VLIAHRPGEQGALVQVAEQAEDPGLRVARRGQAGRQHLGGRVGQGGQQPAHRGGKLADRRGPARLERAEAAALPQQRHDRPGNPGLPDQHAVIAVRLSPRPPGLAAGADRSQRQGRHAGRDPAPPGRLARPEPGLAGQLDPAVRGQQPHRDGPRALAGERLGQQCLGQPGGVGRGRVRRRRDRGVRVAGPAALSRDATRAAGRLLPGE